MMASSTGGSSNAENENSSTTTILVDTLKLKVQTMQKREDNKRNEILSELFADFRKELIISKKEPMMHMLPKAKTKIDHNSNNNNSRTTKHTKITCSGKFP